jgi:hypothetical protein
MTNWTLIALVALAAFGFLLLLYRDPGPSHSPDGPHVRPRPQRDDAEDPAWTTASFQWLRVRLRR